MNNLIIGNTSQLSYFFPENYESISSRNIDFSMVNNKKYDRIYLLFAEQRTFLNTELKLNGYIIMTLLYLSLFKFI